MQEMVVLLKSLMARGVAESNERTCTRTVDVAGIMSWESKRFGWRWSAIPLTFSTWLACSWTDVRRDSSVGT